MGLFDKNVKRTGKGLFGADDPYSVDNLDRQISNATTRIQDAGYTPANADNRNWFEKSTNLPQHQNWFFDTLELLGRPGNAVKNVISYGLDGSDNTGAAIYKGLSGQEKVSGADLAEKMGVDNKVGKFALGVGLDIGLDPTTYIPGGVIAKGIGSAAKPVGSLAKGAYGLAESASPALKTLRETKIEPLADKAKDGLGFMFNPDYKKTETLFGTQDDFLKNLERGTESSRLFMKENAMTNLADTAKLAGGVDKGTDVGRLMEKDLRQFQDVKGYEFPDGLARTENKDDLLGVMNTNRELIKSSGEDIRQIGNTHNKAISETAAELEKVDNQIRKQYFRIEDRTLKQFANREVRQPVNPNFLAQNKAFGQVSASPAFNYLLQRRDELKTTLDTLRTEAQQAKAGSIEHIQKLVDENAALKESSRNPVMIQKEIQRPIREMPQDTNVIKAADNLMKSNESIRSYAAEKGIDVPELAGYMTHVLTQEERARKASNKVLRVDVGQSGTGNPSKNILKNRTVPGSAEDINQKLGRDFFNTNAFFSTGIGQQRLLDYIHAVDFRRQVLSNPNFALKFEQGMDIGKNVKIDSNTYTFLKNTDDALDGVKATDKIGGEYVVTPQVKMLLDRYQKMNTDEGTKAFVKAYDALQGTWKKLALFSPGFHIRNVAGALWNNHLAGMNPYQLVKQTGEAAKEVKNALTGKESDLFREYRAQGLGSTGLTQVEYGTRTTAPEKAIENTIKNRSKDTAGQIKQRLNPLNAFATSREIGDVVDQVNRFALYKWAKGKGMSPEEAAAKVKETLFDYTNLTPFERKARRVVPFYSWSRNNIPFQVKKFIEDPRRFANLNKVRLNAQDAVGLDEKNMPAFMKESLTIPVYGSQGKGKMLGLNLPASDLTKLSNPLKLAVDSLTPLIKTPIELSANYNMFKGKPIQKFVGEKKQFIGGAEIPIKTAYALEQATGQIGRGLSDYLQKPDNVNQDNAFRTPSLGINSVVKDFDAAKNAYFEKLQELKQLQDLMLYVQQQEGAKPRTLTEIKKGSH